MKTLTKNEVIGIINQRILSIPYVPDGWKRGIESRIAIAELKYIRAKIKAYQLRK